MAVPNEKSLKKGKEWKLEITIETYLKNSDIIPLYPRNVWNAEAMIIAPCNSFIICLKLCKIRMISQKILKYLSDRCPAK